MSYIAARWKKWSTFPFSSAICSSEMPRLGSCRSPTTLVIRSAASQSSISSSMRACEPSRTST